MWGPSSRADPQSADSDGDGLTDGEEITGGADGWITDPLQADSDGDGAADNVDGSPVDTSTTAMGTPPAEPSVSLETTTVTVEDDTPVLVEVQNGGGGQLRWTASVDPPGFVAVSPRPDQLRFEGQPVVITPVVPLAELPDTTVTIRVVDARGQDPDEAQIEVHIAGGGLVIGGDMGQTPDMGSNGGGDTGTSPGGDTGGSGGPGSGNGSGKDKGCCGVAASPRSATSTLLLLLCAIAFLFRRRESVR